MRQRLVFASVCGFVIRLSAGETLIEPPQNGRVDKTIAARVALSQNFASTFKPRGSAPRSSIVRLSAVSVRPELTVECQTLSGVEFPERARMCR